MFNTPKNRALVALFATAIILTSALTYVFAAAPSTTFTIGSGIYPASPSYTVYKISSTYYAKDQNGYVEYSSTNASYVINTCLAALSGTSGETVYLKGSLTLTHSIIIQKNWTTLFVDGLLTAANGLNQALIRIPETSVLYGVTIEGIGASSELNGNSTGQTSDLASGINLTRSTGSLPAYTSPIPSIQVKNLYITDCYGPGVYCYFAGTGDGGELGFTGVSVQNCGTSAGDVTGGFGGGAVVWYNVYDSYWRGGLIAGTNAATDYAFLGLVLSGCEINPYYMNGHSKVYTGNRVDWSCQYMDNSGDIDTLALYNVNTSRVHDSTFNIMTGMDNNTYSGVTMGPDPDCFNNVFSSLVFSSYGATLMFQYGVEEVDNGSTLNVFTGITGGQYGTGAVMLQGAGSEADADDIIGTIV